MPSREYTLIALLLVGLSSGVAASSADDARLAEIPEILILRSDFQEEAEAAPEDTRQFDLPAPDLEAAEEAAEDAIGPPPKPAAGRRDSAVPTPAAASPESVDEQVTVYEPGEVVEYVEDYGVAGGACIDSCPPGPAPCLFFPSGGVWARGEYLLWAAKGMETPPLVTGGSTGVLGDQDTMLLYGDETILDEMQSGFRVEIGTWLDCNRLYGLEADFWTLGEESTRFSAASDEDGEPALFRPFYNINPRLGNNELDPPAMADAEIVASPGMLAGSVQVDAYTELLGTGIRFRKRMCCDTGCVTCRDACGRPRGVPRTTRLDFLVGYRYLRLDEGLSVREDLTSLLSVPEQGSFEIQDSFETANTFNGVDLGVSWERAWGRWSVGLLGKLGLGNMEQVVNIRGRTTISDALSGNGEYLGGLLAQRTNIGEYQREVFAVVPELGATVGYQLNSHWRATCGYTFLYLSRVVRPGEQIDLDVNPDLFPPEFTPFAGLERPEFTFRDTDFWAQGLNIGLQCRF
jgi:hypothetical protein